MIDTHCHIDLYDNPIEIAKESEKTGIVTIGMTNLPSHFEMGYEHLRSFKKVRLALGLHPLYSEFHEAELPCFIKNIDNTSYIGEIGLDFSKEGIGTKDIQLKTFKRILQELEGKKKIISLHSRKAENSILDLLVQHNFKSAIFHWYTGPLPLINKITDAGFYLSVNTAMIKSKSGQAVISKIPKEFLLTESDGPFIQQSNKPVKPNDINLVINYLSNLWALPSKEVNEIIDNNFNRLLNTIRLS
jgi:TatD DNase family protein